MVSSKSANITVQQAITELDDKRVKAVRPLIPPQILSEELPLDLRGAQTVLVRRLQALWAATCSRHVAAVCELTG